jgi:putative YphP/YqiW family bacilliredoxin
MPYSPLLIRPMREELTSAGFAELRTAEEVNSLLDEKGTTLVVVNSVCGCAAGGARPGARLAIQESPRPDRLATVFAGQDLEATARVRAYFGRDSAVVAVHGAVQGRRAGLVPAPPPDRRPRRAGGGSGPAGGVRCPLRSRSGRWLSDPGPPTPVHRPWGLFTTTSTSCTASPSSSKPPEPELYIGRCDDIVAQGVILRDADVHREGDPDLGGEEPRRVPRPGPAIRRLAESQAHPRSGGERARDPSPRRNLKPSRQESES